MPSQIYVPDELVKLILAGNDDRAKAIVANLRRGPTPTESDHLATKGYVDTGIGSFYGFSAYLSADQLNITGIDKIDWDSVFFDTTGGDYASGTFTPSIAGYYGFSTAVKWINISSTDDRYLYFYKAGAIYRASLIDLIVGSHPPLSGVVYANGTTDTFDVYAQNVASNTTDIDASISVAGDASWFDMHLIKAT